ncbi:uncharacterized protein LOC144386383 [Gasterosteus aculeatus]
MYLALLERDMWNTRLRLTRPRMKHVLEWNRFLGSIITQDLKWELNISSITKKAQQRLFFLRQLKKFNLPKTLMVHFYTAIMESILCSSISVWYAAATAKDK